MVLIICCLSLYTVQRLCLIAGVLRAVVEAANAGASVLCLCEKGDAMIMEETGKIFKKEKEMKKGEACTKNQGFGPARRLV